MNTRVWINCKEIPPYPPLDGAAPAERYFTMSADGVLCLVDSSGKLLTIEKGAMVQVNGPHSRDDYAAGKLHGLKKAGLYSRPADVLGDQARYQRRRRKARAAKQARKAARRLK